MGSSILQNGQTIYGRLCFSTAIISQWRRPAAAASSTWTCTPPLFSQGGREFVISETNRGPGRNLPTTKLFPFLLHYYYFLNFYRRRVPMFGVDTLCVTFRRKLRHLVVILLLDYSYSQNIVQTNPPSFVLNQLDMQLMLPIYFESFRNYLHRLQH